MRLIDADEYAYFMKTFANDIRNAKPNVAEFLDVIVGSICEWPTAYDIDKIVEELEKSKEVIATTRYCRKYVNNGSCDEKDCFKCIADYLIDIVKAGVVND